MNKRQNHNISSRFEKNRFGHFHLVSGIVFLTVFLVSTFGLAQSSEYPYQLKKSDYYIVPSTWAFALVLKYGIAPNDLLTNEEIETLTADPVFNIDNVALNKYNPSLDKAGDAIVGASLFMPILLSIPALKEQNWQQVGTINMMYAEVLGITFGLSEMSKIAVRRVRPYMYNSDLSVDERFQLNSTGDGEKSFYSMHTAFAFSSAVFLSKVYSDCFGKTVNSKLIWAGSLGLATTIGITRVYSGQHFPTDVLVGALVGGLTGYLVPTFHKNNQTRTSLIIAPNAIQVRIKI
jgi:membrane-associated phospholipid phosphatase